MCSGRNERPNRNPPTLPTPFWLSRTFDAENPLVIAHPSSRQAAAAFAVLLSLSSCSPADNGPVGYREAIERADRFYGGPGALDAKLATVLPRTPDEPGGQAFFQRVALERAKLGMAAGLPGGEVTLRDVNAYLRAKARREVAGDGTAT